MVVEVMTHTLMTTNDGSDGNHDAMDYDNDQGDDAAGNPAVRCLHCIRALGGARLGLLRLGHLLRLPLSEALRPRAFLVRFYGLSDHRVVHSNEPHVRVQGPEIL